MKFQLRVTLPRSKFLHSVTSSLRMTENLKVVVLRRFLPWISSNKSVGALEARSERKAARSDRSAAKRAEATRSVISIIYALTATLTRAASHCDLPRFLLIIALASAYKKDLFLALERSSLNNFLWKNVVQSNNCFNDKKPDRGRHYTSVATFISTQTCFKR